MTARAGGAARLAAALFLLLAGCGGASEPAAKATAADPSYGACAEIEFEGSTLTDCIADPARHTIRTVLAGPDGTPLRSFARLAATLQGGTSGVAFAVNAGMFDTAGEPIGYYVEGGRRGHRLNRADGAGNFHLQPNGVFFGDAAGPWRVLPSARFAAEVNRRPAFGTQSGPMLVIDGKLHPRFSADGESLKIRNGVGVDRQGRAHFVISEEPVSFGRFARYFRDRVGTRDALFLDGQVSSLWDPAHGRMDAVVPIGPMIVVEMRSDRD